MPTSELEFEYHYFNLKKLQLNVEGYDRTGRPAFLLEKTVELLYPRNRLFSGSSLQWLPPSPIQSQAILLLLSQQKDLLDISGIHHSSLPRIKREGFQKFYQWRFLLDLLQIPCQPLSSLDLKPYQYGKPLS